MEKELDVELNAVRAYCVKREGKFPDLNFEKVVPETIESDDVDTLVLETGSIEISNIDVNRAVMNFDKSVEESKREWFEEAEETSKALFQIAEDCVSKDKELNVVIVKRPPRFDKTTNDILGIKQKISDYANKIYDQCVLKSSNAERIHLVELDLIQKSNYLKELIYGRQDNERYDGIHLAGSGSSRHFTYRVVQSLKQILEDRKSKMLHSHYHSGRSERLSRAERKSEEYDHTHCPQAQYQRVMRGNRAFGPRQYVSYASVVKSNIRDEQNYNFAIPTRNRFDQLLRQGNW